MAALRNASTGAVLSQTVRRAVTPWQRTIGFLREARIDSLRGWWFGGCRAIHTLGMRSRVDLLLLDAHDVVIALEPDVRPNRSYVSRRGTRTIVEMGPGFLAAAAVRVGDRLSLDGESAAQPATR